MQGVSIQSAESAFMHNRLSAATEQQCWWSSCNLICRGGWWPAFDDDGNSSNLLAAEHGLTSPTHTSLTLDLENLKNSQQCVGQQTPFSPSKAGAAPAAAAAAAAAQPAFNSHNNNKDYAPGVDAMLPPGAPHAVLPATTAVDLAISPSAGGGGALLATACICLTWCCWTMAARWPPAPRVQSTYT